MFHMALQLIPFTLQKELAPVKFVFENARSASLFADIGALFIFGETINRNFSSEN